MMNESRQKQVFIDFLLECGIPFITVHRTTHEVPASSGQYVRLSDSDVDMIPDIARKDGVV